MGKSTPNEQFRSVLGLNLQRRGKRSTEKPSNFIHRAPGGCEGRVVGRYNPINYFPNDLSCFTRNPKFVFTLASSSHAASCHDEAPA